MPGASGGGDGAIGGAGSGGGGAGGAAESSGGGAVRLSSSKFPTLAALRSAEAAKQSQVDALLAALPDTLPSAAMANELRRLDGRWVVPVEVRTSSNSGSGGSNSNGDSLGGRRNTGRYRRVKDLGRRRGSSRSGKTAYVEPRQLEKPTQELQLAQEATETEDLRLRRTLSEAVARHGDALAAALTAAGAVDGFLARASLGLRTGTTCGGTGTGTGTGDGTGGGFRNRVVIPEVGSEGVVRLADCLNPLLALLSPSSASSTAGGGKAVVGHDLILGHDDADDCGDFDEEDAVGGELRGNRGLVITGPNAGGKTVVLKTFGLCALLCRMGVPLPADPTGLRLGRDTALSSSPSSPLSSSSSSGHLSPRFDFFDGVVADIGDAQSLTDGLSTFAAQVTLWNAVVRRLEGNSHGDGSDGGVEEEREEDDEGSIGRSCGSGSILVLLDELGGGTETDAGGALAAATVEAIVGSAVFGASDSVEEEESSSGGGAIGRRRSRTRARLVATTHHDLLKRTALLSPYLEVAAMGAPPEVEAEAAAAAAAAATAAATAAAAVRRNARQQQRR